MLVVLYVESTPDHLRGYLDRFLQELRTGVYVGSTTTRVAEGLWAVVEQYGSSGDAFMAYATSESETGFRLLSRPHPRWRVVDVDGIDLVGTVTRSQ